jgi:hypothetical protein
MARTRSRGPAKYAAELFEYIAEGAKASKIAEVGSRAIDACVPKLIVQLPLLRVVQHFVGFADFLEACFGARLAIHVRMVLASHLTKRTLQRGVVNIPLDA